MSKAHFKDIEKLRRMKRGRKTQNEEKKGYDALTPLGSLISPRSPDEGVNVDHNEHHGS